MPECPSSDPGASSSRSTRRDRRSSPGRGNAASRRCRDRGSTSRVGIWPNQHLRSSSQLPQLDRATWRRRRSRRMQRAERGEPRTGALVRPFLRLPFRHGDRLPVELRATVYPSDERVTHVVLVVAVWIVVRTRVGAAAFLARQPRDDHAVGELEQEPELKSLRQVVVEDLALVLDDDVLVPLAQRGHDLALLLHLVLAAEDAEVLVHRLRERSEEHTSELQSRENLVCSLM